MRIQRRSSKKARIEIIPIIDTIFFLLVFFMISTLSMSQFKGMPVNLPKAASGKTGTAQVIEMKAAYLKSEQLSYFNRDHAWFVAYAPVDNPQVAIAVLVEHGGHGGEAAAPMAKKVFEKFVEEQKQATDKQQVRADGASRAN